MLERLSTLQTTILALKELAGLSQEMNQSFTTEASELLFETSSQLDTFGQFEDQQQRIEVLQRRVHAGRDKIQGLSDRVDRVKERIERWERADREWQERTRRRLRWVWMVTSLLIFFVVLLVLSAQYTAPPGVGLGEATTQLVSDGLDMVKNVTTNSSGQNIRSYDGGGGNGAPEGEQGRDDPQKRVLSAIRSESDSKSETSSSTLVLPTPSSSLGDKDLLRAFDEL